MSDLKICPACGTEYPLSERFCPRDGSPLRSASPTADLLGQIVADRFHIMKKLGEGGMGTVYLAEHVKMGRKAALKVMNPGMNTDPDAIARFHREAANASRLSHANICAIYDFGETPDGLIYLAMEFIEGVSLSSLIEKDGALPAARASSIIHQTADALAVAHDAGIVHRDLKPDNIMVAKNRDGSDLVKVVDFGIAKASSSDAQKVTKTGLVVGTPEYMSPEQLAGDKLDGRSDTYSLGLVAFNCLTGALPFASESAQEAMIMRLTDSPRTLAEVAPDKEWPAALQATLDKALARSADERYQSAAQFGREFAAAISDMPMTRAIEAGTQVVSAAAAAKAAPKSPQVPQTRVARPSSKTEVVEAPGGRGRVREAAERGTGGDVGVRGGSRGLLYGGAGVAVVGVAVVAAMQFGLIGGGNGATPPDTTTRVVSDTGAGGTARPPGDTGGTGKAPGPVTPNRPTGSNGTNPGPNTTPTPPPVDPRVAELEANSRVITLWRGRIDGLVGASESEISRVTRDALVELGPVLRAASGAQLDSARFVALLAYAAADDAPKVCEYEKMVRLSRLPSGDKATAAAMVAPLECTP